MYQISCSVFSLSLIALHTFLSYILNFHLHPDVRSPGVDVRAVETMGENDDVSDVTLTASGLGGVVAKRIKIIKTLKTKI